MSDIILSTVRPDFNDIVTQLQTLLLTRDTWKDRLTTSTGQTLVEFIAAIGAYDQFSIESAFQEVFPESAKNPNSLYAAAEFAGVRTNRKLSASVTVNLSAPVAQTIPAYSQFVGGGTFWYNKTPLSVTTSPSPFTLYQGKVVAISTTGLGTDFQSFVTPEKDFVVHDEDLIVQINGVSQYVTTDGLWTRPGLDGVQNKTLPDGKMLLLFGNDLFGSKPSTSDDIDVTYIVTMGGDGNNLALIGRSLALDTNTAVAGTFTSASSGGGEQAPYLVYKNLTPALFGAFNSSVTALQYKRLPLQYPGVIDGFTLAQREINPRALKWMNAIKVCLLTASPMSGPAWLAFKDFFQRNTMYSTEIYREDPVAVDVTVSAQVYCANFSNLSEIEAKVNAAIDALFAPRQGIIGLDIYLSDIYDTIMAADANIKYVRLLAPTTDQVISSLNVAAPTLTAVPGGTIAAGTYDYAISVISGLGGETAPANWSTIVTVTGSQSVQLNWSKVTNGVGYKVWGRQTSGTLGLIATLGDVDTYTDTGSIVPSGTVPSQSTVGIYYPRLLSKTVSMFYSARANEVE